MVPSDSPTPRHHTEVLCQGWAGLSRTKVTMPRMHCHSRTWGSVLAGHWWFSDLFGRPVLRVANWRNWKWKGMMIERFNNDERWLLLAESRWYILHARLLRPALKIGRQTQATRSCTGAWDWSCQATQCQNMPKLRCQIFSVGEKGGEMERQRRREKEASRMQDG